MRKIKFRGLKVDGKGWFYGDLLNAHSGNKLITIELPEEELNMYTHQVTPESVGQFTGLLDKNGVEIYEGDVVIAYNDSLEITETRPVTFELGTFSVGRYWKDGQHDWYSMEQYDSFELEVIGNIHENK